MLSMLLFLKKTNDKNLKCFRNTQSNWKTSKHNENIINRDIWKILQTLAQLVAQIREEENNYSGDDNDHNNK